MTLNGLKQSASNSLYSPPCHPAAVVLTSKSTETTREWLKDGGKVGAETNRQTSSSAAFTLSCTLSSLPYTQDMFQARKTLPTDPHKVYTQPLCSFCPKFPSPQSYASSLSTSTMGPPAWIQDILSTIHQLFYPSPIACSLTMSAPLSMQSLTTMGRSSSLPTHRVTPEWCPWHVPLPPLPSKSNHRPTPYRKNLEPLPSPLQPHCPANQRLHRWRPLIPRAQCTSQFADNDLKWIEAVMACAWEVDTHASYGSGLLNFMVFCDKKNIPDADRAPASHILLLSFLSTLAAPYSGSAISNYLYGI